MPETPENRIDPLRLVHPAYCADPFVLAADGAYYAFGTEGAALPGGRRFVLLRSEDLIRWEELGGALVPPDDPGLGKNFWAPEVARGDDGRYYLYYSVGPEGEMLHQLRVAVAERPEGPYLDVPGGPLLPLSVCPFAIDAHPFRDADGTWYLFYARDFLDADGGEGYRSGTGLVVDRLVDMVSLAGEERVVLRARHEWQRFQKDRAMAGYGGRVFDWHTLEGAFVVPHGGRYYCLFSAAAYHSENYGVDYAVADHPFGPWSDAGGENGPRILKTLPGRLRGPGHNSVFTGPGGRQYVAFHAWDEAHRARQMHLAPLVWTPDGPRCSLEPFSPAEGV